MRDFVIVTESTCDLPAKMADDMGLIIAPLTFHIGEENYVNHLDGRDMDYKEFFRRIKAGEKASTSQVSPADFMEKFQEITDAGQDILHIGFSSGLSGTFNAGVLAAKEIMAANPEAKIINIDTLSASLGQGLILHYAVEMKNQGKSMDEIALWVEDIKLKVNHWVAVDDLEHLHRGGRCSGISAFAGSLLNIKPLIHINNEGRLVPREKVRSTKKALSALVDKLEQNGVDIENQIIFISHADTDSSAEFLISQIKERLKVKDILCCPIGPVIGAHTGQGTIAVFYIGSER